MTIDREVKAMSRPSPTAFMGLDEDICEKALQLIKPSIKAAMKPQPSGDRLLNRDQGHLVVLNPQRPYEPKYWGGPHDDPCDEFLELVLFQEDFGSEEEWEHPFRAHAYSKAYVALKTGLPSRAVQQSAPWAYFAGVTKYGGSAVAPGGLVVAFSGVQEWFDEMISEWMISAIKAVCVERMQEVMGEDSIAFLGTGGLPDGFTDRPSSIPQRGR